jgi:hypothetical protein
VVSAREGICISCNVALGEPNYSKTYKPSASLRTDLFRPSVGTFVGMLFHNAAQSGVARPPRRRGTRLATRLIEVDETCETRCRSALLVSAFTRSDGSSKACRLS